MADESEELFELSDILEFANKILVMPPNKAISFLEKAVGRKQAIKDYKGLRTSPAAMMLKEQGQLPDWHEI